MPTPVLMPALSPTMEKGNLAKWHKKEGDSVKSGDVIAEIETDKATMEVEAVDEGTLGKILVPEGTNDVAVNTPIAMILAEGEDASAVKDGNGGAPPPAKAAQPAPQQKGAESAPLPTASRQDRSPPQAAARRRRPSGAPEPDVPEGTEMVTMTVREALRDAMAEEMRRDQDVFVMGEEVAEYQGAYKVTQGLLQEFGAHARDRHADHRAWLRRPRHRRGARRAQADRRVHDLQFRHAGDGPAHQLRRQDPLHVGRPDAVLDRVPRAERSGRARRGSAQPGFQFLVFAHSGPEGGRALHARPTPRGC